jgi:NADPH:quinone reductase-like Zn-dependent oxidoreductase
MQLGKAFGMYVVGVCSTADLSFVKSTLGADEVVDYTSTNFAETYANAPFDFVVDPMGIRGGCMRLPHACMPDRDAHYNVLVK